MESKPTYDARASLHRRLDEMFPGDMLALLANCTALVNDAGRGQVVLISRAGSVNVIVPCPHLRENDLTLFSIERGWK